MEQLRGKQKKKHGEKEIYCLAASDSFDRWTRMKEKKTLSITACWKKLQNKTRKYRISVTATYDS